MKILLLLLLLIPTLHADSITVKKAPESHTYKTYWDITVRNTTKGSIKIFHRSGATEIYASQMTPKQRLKYNITLMGGMEYIKEQNKLQTHNNQALNKIDVSRDTVRKQQVLKKATERTQAIERPRGDTTHYDMEFLRQMVSGQRRKFKYHKYHHSTHRRGIVRYAKPTSHSCMMGIYCPKHWKLNYGCARKDKRAKEISDMLKR